VREIYFFVNALPLLYALFQNNQDGEDGEHMRRVFHAPPRAERNFDHKGAKARLAAIFRRGRLKSGEKWSGASFGLLGRVVLV
jgi:proline racemase